MGAKFPILLLLVTAILVGPAPSWGDDSETAARLAEAASEYPDRDLREPVYTYLRPSWAFEATGTWRAFGKSALNPGGPDPAQYSKGVTLSWQFSPPWIQRAGLLSFGPSLGVFPVASSSGITQSPFNLWQVGGEVQYQARLFHEQALVPVAGFEYEWLNYAFVTGTKGRMTLTGPYFGAYLFLNFFEPESAANMFTNHEILRSYFVAEIRNLQGSSRDFAISGPSYFFGIRLEY